MKTNEMPKIIKISILAALALGVFSFGVPVFFHFASVSAQEVKGGYELLSPLTPEQVGKEVELGSYLSTLFKIFLAAAGILATLMIVLAGFQYMTSEAAGSKKNALDKFRNAVIGLLLALGSYLFLNTINPKLVNVSFNLEPVDIKVSSGNGDTANGGTGPAVGNWHDDTKERDELLSAGIYVNNPNCKYIGEEDCTSVAGLPESAITAIITLHEACRCSVTITGGSEFWLHNRNTSHKYGNGVVDLKAVGSLNKFLTGESKNPSDKFRVVKGRGTYTFEVYGSNAANNGIHWHVSYN